MRGRPVQGRSHALLAPSNRSVVPDVNDDLPAGRERFAKSCVKLFAGTGAVTCATR